MSWAKILQVVSLAAMAAGISGVAGGAQAAERQTDRIYADSFGNLVIVSRAGFKRIVVGQGHLASELNAYSNGGADEPKVVRGGEYPKTSCYQAPYFWKGRSYMYGFSEGVIPQPPVTCTTE